ncbi:hypothetical protein KL921_001170 [Ogataea angusta]|nr:hypothetical protein KL921_001170 [Ogataea angusta]
MQTFYSNKAAAAESRGAVCGTCMSRRRDLGDEYSHSDNSSDISNAIFAPHNNAVKFQMFNHRRYEREYRSLSAAARIR